MKKKVFMLVLLISLMFPIHALAKTYYDDYNTLNFVDALKAEGMEIENKDYKETNDQAIIYLFRGQGCGYCKKLLTYLNSISKEYGKYFKVVSFEVWNDSKNSALMTKVATSKGDTANGVPYYIIGDETFGGYSEEYNDRIVKAIMDNYNNPDSHGDVFKDLEKSEKKDESTGGGDTFAIVFWNFVIIAAATGVVIYLNNKNKQEILDAINGNKKMKNK